MLYFDIKRLFICCEFVTTLIIIIQNFITKKSHKKHNEYQFVGKVAKFLISDTTYTQ